VELVLPGRAVPREGKGKEANLELTVVMPVYNEEAALPGVLAAWTGELDRLGMDYRLCVYDDGSRDGTGRVLEEEARRHPRVVARSHANRGHGPTILRGYREAEGDWVFQVDSDGEMPPGGFESLWSRREAYDLLVGSRAGRKEPPVRYLITAVSRLTVRALFGRGVADVNAPYRLMRRERLQALLQEIQGEPFAPNVILSGLAARARLRIGEWPVPCVGRHAGRSSLTPVRILKGSVRSFFETLGTAARRRRKG
jgi:dolichol-phosphate mannosyltransferase